MRCNGQYNTSMVVTELDGSLDDPSYISTLPEGARLGNQNVFPFSLSLAAMEVNMMLHYLLALDWWTRLQQQDYQFTLGTIRSLQGECRAHCEFRQRIALGDLAAPRYLRDRVAPEPAPPESVRSASWWKSLLSKLFSRPTRLKG